MKRRLTLRLLLTFLCLAAGGFLLVSTVVSFALDRYLTTYEAERLYREAVLLSRNYLAAYQQGRPRNVVN